MKKTKYYIFIAIFFVNIIFLLAVVPELSRLESRMFPVGENFTMVSLSETKDGKTVIRGYNTRLRECKLNTISLLYGTDPYALVPISFKFKLFPKLKLGTNTWIVVANIEKDYITKDSLHVRIGYTCHKLWDITTTYTLEMPVPTTRKTYVEFYK